MERLNWRSPSNPFPRGTLGDHVGERQKEGMEDTRRTRCSESTGQGSNEPTKTEQQTQDLQGYSPGPLCVYYSF